MKRRQTGSPQMIKCSFCARGQDEVAKLVAGPSSVYICSECIKLCNDILEGELLDETTLAPPRFPKPRESFGQQCLARAGGADEKDVGLLELGGIVVEIGVDSLVVVVHGNGQRLLGPLLPDDVLVQAGLDLGRLGQVDGDGGRLAAHLLLEDVVAELDALVADVDGRTRHELGDLVLPPAAERALDGVRGIHALFHPTSTFRR